MRSATTAIVESMDSRPANVAAADWEPRTFHAYARLDGEMVPLRRSARTLDGALLTAIAYKHEYRRGGFNDAANSQAVRFFRKMIDMDATED